MALTAVHATQAVGTYTPEGELGPAEWNAPHTITGTLDVANGGTGASTARGAAAALSVPYVFANSAVAQSIGAVSTETVLATITIPGGAMGPNGYVDVYTSWTVNNNANQKQVLIRVGGAAGTLYQNSNLANFINNSRLTRILNVNSQSSQKSAAQNGNAGGFGNAGGAISTSTVDTSADWDLVIAGQKVGSSADTITLENYTVIIYYGA